MMPYPVWDLFVYTTLHVVQVKNRARVDMEPRPTANQSMVPALVNICLFYLI